MTEGNINGSWNSFGISSAEQAGGECPAPTGSGANAGGQSSPIPAGSRANAGGASPIPAGSCRTVDYDKSRWAAIEGGLAGAVDRHHYELGASRLKDDTAALTEQILASYKVCDSESRSTWMRRLAQDSMRFLARQRGVKLQAMREETIFNQALSELIQRIFDYLQTYSYDFNHVMGWNELRVTCTKPGFVTEILRYNKFREPLETITNFRARLSTRYMSLVIRGRRDTIEFLFLPVDKVIGLSKAEGAYTPVCQIKGNLADDRITWQFGEEPLSNEQLAVLCMDLFAGLIERTKTESAAEHCA